MSAVETREVTTTRHEYRIPAPACWTDVKMAMQWAADARREKGLSVNYDDIIKVEGDDEYVTVYWEEKN